MIPYLLKKKERKQRRNKKKGKNKNKGAGKDDTAAAARGLTVLANGVYAGADTLRTSAGASIATDLQVREEAHCGASSASHGAAAVQCGAR